MTSSLNVTLTRFPACCVVIAMMTSEMPGLTLGGIGPVVQHIEVAHRQSSERARIHAVQGVHAQGDRRDALRIDSAREGPHAAGPAEEMVQALLAELIVDQVAFAGQQAHVAGRYEGKPCARLRAERAVAAEGDLLEVGFGLEAHRAAMA